MKFISNVPMRNKQLYLAAAERTVAKVEWRDEPNESMDGLSNRHLFGSIRSDENDLSAFWDKVRELEANIERINQTWRLIEK